MKVRKVCDDQEKDLKQLVVDKKIVTEDSNFLDF